MTTLSIPSGARLRVVLASSVVGALAGAFWPLGGLAVIGQLLPGLFGKGTGATGADALASALGGLIVGTGVAIVCIAAVGARPRRARLMPLAMVTGLVLTETLALWEQRDAYEEGEPLIFFGLMGVLGLLLGFIIALTIRAALGWSNRPRRDARR